MSKDLKPTYLYKIIPFSAAPLDALPERLPLSELDEKSGFIHLSTSVQVLGTVKKFFADETQIYLLRLDYENVEKDIRWETPSGDAPGEMGAEGIFPHLHNGGQLGYNQVQSVVVLNRSTEADGGGWESQLKELEESWFKY